MIKEAAKKAEKPVASEKTTAEGDNGETKESHEGEEEEHVEEDDEVEALGKKEWEFHQ